MVEQQAPPAAVEAPQAAAVPDYAPYAEPEVFRCQDSRNQPAWAWRCWGSAHCKGWVGIDLYSEEAARSELDRHLAEEHKESPRG